MMRGNVFVGDRKPHILYRNGLWRCYRLTWDARRQWTTGLVLGLGHTPIEAHTRMILRPTRDNGPRLYTLKL